MKPPPVTAVARCDDAPSPRHEQRGLATCRALYDEEKPDRSRGGRAELIAAELGAKACSGVVIVCGGVRWKQRR